MIQTISISKSRFQYFLLISFLLVGQSTQVTAQTWKEKAKAKYEAAAAKINGDTPPSKDEKPKNKEKEADEKKKVKIIDLGTHPEQSQLTTYQNSKFYKEKMEELDFYIFNKTTKEFIESNDKKEIILFMKEISFYFGGKRRRYSPFTWSKSEKNDLFYQAFTAYTSQFILIGDDHIYAMTLSEGVWSCEFIFGDKPPTSDIEVLIASNKDHFERSKVAAEKAIQEYEDSKFNLSSLKYEDIENIDMQFRPGEDAAKTAYPGIVITMKNGDTHKSTNLDGRMVLSKQLKYSPVKKSEGGGQFTHAFEALHDSRIQCTKTFGAKLSTTLTIDQNGSFGSNGANITISIKAKTTEDGKEYLYAKVDGFGGVEYHRLTTYPIIKVNANGGNGRDGAKGTESRDPHSYSGNGSDGQNGGNGGNVTIIVDPNVKNGQDFKSSSVYVNGGNAGTFGVSGACWDCKGKGKAGANGTPGKKGTYTFKIEKVDI